MKTSALIQARMGSNRLPGKVLEPLAGAPAIVRIVERVRAARQIDEVVVVTSDLERDDVVAQVCAEHDITVVRGSEDDVLDRFQRAASVLDVQRVVRITADCPLIDPEVIDQLIEYSEQPGVVYASIPSGAIPASRGYLRFPDGLDVEVFSAAVLETAWQEASDPYEREHVTPFIWRRPERFTQVVMEADHDMGDERWTVDFPEDLELIRAIYDMLYRPDVVFGFRDVVALLDAQPQLRAINVARRAAS